MDIVSIISITSATLITLANIIIPLIKFIFDTKKMRQQKELELFYENKVNFYKEFCTKFGIINTHAYEDNIQAFSESVSNALLFANEEVKLKLLEITSILGNYFVDKINSLNLLKTMYPEIINLIANDLAQSYKSITKR